MLCFLSQFRLTAFIVLLHCGLTHASRAQAVAPDTAVFAGIPQATVPLGQPLAFPEFKAGFYDNQLFLLGEAHGTERPQELDLALLQHLNQRAGVRTYVGEVDCAKAYFLNEYLRTGKAATLDLIFRSWQADGSQWANTAMRAKFQKLRSWNQTLPARRRVRVLGIDQLQDLPLAADYLRVLTRGLTLPPAVRGQLDSVAIWLQRENGEQAAAGATRAMRLLAGSKPDKALFDLTHLLRNVAYDRRNMAVREQNIFANFRELYLGLHLEGEKLYGMWGLAHVLQSPMQSGTTLFAGLVRQSDLPVRDKVVSLLCVFSECQLLMPTSFLPAAWQVPGQRFTPSDKFNHDGPLTRIAGLEELKRRTQPGTTTIFQLNAPAAATNRQPIRVTYAPGIPAGQQIRFRADLPATAYVQYLVLVRNSPALTPLVP
ncbi:erythromycin esterase family protein [Hymenobacter endophyticus]|uniref:Erythromycin esterase family protein n=1 Tax=Hymenobacter endophyticus TaxID=3076335 RepID=A0ABU3TDA4_9BACT|nr:erythromycin esterase family protein [Hymenobacter endophyticus]MDU0369356.1 erythromycin esterase family protein [Hymenobacter endophyticus]